MCYTNTGLNREKVTPFKLCGLGSGYTLDQVPVPQSHNAVTRFQAVLQKHENWKLNCAFYAKFALSWAILCCRFHQISVGTISLVLQVFIKFVS